MLNGGVLSSAILIQTFKVSLIKRKYICKFTVNSYEISLLNWDIIAELAILTKNVIMYFHLVGGYGAP